MPPIAGRSRGLTALVGEELCKEMVSSKTVPLVLPKSNYLNRWYSFY